QLARSERFTQFAARAAGSIAHGTAIYVAVDFALAPVLWRTPSTMALQFAALGQYGLRGSTSLLALLALAAAGVFYARRPLARLAAHLGGQHTLILSIVGALIMVVSLIHQRGDLYWPRGETALRALAAQHIVISPRMADVQLSTMDTSVWLT